VSTSADERLEPALECDKSLEGASLVATGDAGGTTVALASSLKAHAGDGRRAHELSGKAQVKRVTLAHSSDAP
jgi:hypothetical protein